MVNGVIDLTEAVGQNVTICRTAPIFVVETDNDGSITGNQIDILPISTSSTRPDSYPESVITVTDDTVAYNTAAATSSYSYAQTGTSGDAKHILLMKKPTGTLTQDMFNKTVFVDYYIVKKGKDISEIQIDAANFAGYYYVEASTLFRRQADGVDMPAQITFPNVKIQSNFTFTMASTGDPSEQMRLAA